LSLIKSDGYLNY